MDWSNGKILSVDANTSSAIQNGTMSDDAESLALSQLKVNLRNEKNFKRGRKRSIRGRQRKTSGQHDYE